MANISRHQFKDVMRKSTFLSQKERRQLEKNISDKFSGGLSKQELEKEIHHLKGESSDILDSDELRRFEHKAEKEMSDLDQ